MATKTIKVWMYKTNYANRIISDFEFSDDPDYILMGTGGAVIEMLPDEEIVKAQVESLERQIDETRTEAAVKIRKLEEAIQSLLSITHQP
jgi:hypothetical protein